MAYVLRTRTIVERVDVNDDDEFNPQVAIGMARATKVWTALSDVTIYEAHSDAPEGCTVSQLTGRSPKGKQ